MIIPAGITVSSPNIGGVVKLFPAIFLQKQYGKNKLFHFSERKTTFFVHNYNIYARLFLLKRNYRKPPYITCSEALHY